MTEQSIGTARLDVVVDKSNAEASLDALNRKVSETGKVSDDTTKRTEQNSARQIAALKRQAETFGLTREEMVRYRIETQTTGKVQQELLAKLDQSAQRLKASGAAFNQFGVSAKQQAAALRGVPAQLTDIFTSLASGQRPITVLLQQGGQLKDMFGGIVPAARALGSAMLGLVNPLTLTIGAVVGLGVAFKAASDEQAEFEKALILTGNTAGTTAENLRDMAGQLDSTTGLTAGKASEVLASVAATGKFTADQIQLVATAAANLEDATGRSIEKTIAEFAELEKDPVNAILKLNDAIGDGTNVTNFLTQAQIDAIAKFKEQGREADAAKVAIQAYADAINDRAPEVIENLGLFSRWWREVAKTAREAGDAAVNVFRDAENAAQSFFDNSAAARNSLAALAPFVPGTRELFNAVSKPQFGGVKGSVRGDQLAIVDSQQFKDRQEAEKDFARLQQDNLSKREKLEKEIAEIREVGLKAGKNDLEIQKAINDARARYEESLPKGKKPKKVNTRGIENASDRFDDMVGRFQAELQGPLEKAEQDHLKRMRELQQAARDGKKSHEELAAALNLEGQAYAKTREEIEQRIDVEVASLSGPLAAAQAQHEEALRRIEELKKTGRVTGDEYNAMLAEEAIRFQQAGDEAARAADPIGALLSDMAAEVDAIGKSRAELAVLIELRRQHIDVMSAEGQAALESARMFEEEAAAKQRSIDLMDDFRQGAANALTDIVTGAKSAKEAFADFLNDLAKRLTQMIAERWIERAFGAQGSDGSGTSGGDALGKWIGAIFGGGNNGTTTNGWFGFWKNGGAFANGMPVSYFARGDVFDSPTAFGMRGGMGVMGEAGPEAVMPLKRGPDGKLGVVASGGGSTTLHQTFVVQGSPDRRTREQMARDGGREARRGIARTG